MRLDALEVSLLQWGIRGLLFWIAVDQGAFSLFVKNVIQLLFLLAFFKLRNYEIFEFSFTVVQKKKGSYDCNQAHSFLLGEPSNSRFLIRG